MSETAHRTLLQHTVMTAGVMLGSKLLGFIRQAVIAGVFGTSQSTDIYFISNELMINLSGALTAALTSAMITQYIAVVRTQGRGEGSRLVSRVLSMLLLVAVLAMTALDLLAYPISHLLGPGMDAQALGEMARYLRLFSPAFVFSAMQAVYAAVLNANDRFVPGKLYGVIFNPLAILAVALLGAKLGISVLVWAYYGANVLVMLMLYSTSRKIYRFRLIPFWRDQRLKKLLLLALPMLVSNVAIQLSGVVDKAVCAGLGTGIASDYSYAHTLEQFVTGIFTATVMLVLFPRITWLAARDAESRLRDMLQQAASAVVQLLAPVALITVVSAVDIVTVVYQRGGFTDEAVRYTAMALAGFALGFPAVAIRELMLRVHFAFQETKVPMGIGTVEMTVNILLSLLLAQIWGVFGVTMATSLSAALSAFLMARTAKRYVPELGLRGMGPEFLRCGIALVACCGAVLLAGNCEGTVLRLILRLTLGCGAYGIVLLALNRGRLPTCFKLFFGSRQGNWDDGRNSSENSDW